MGKKVGKKDISVFLIKEQTGAYGIDSPFYIAKAASI